ncbi:MAG: hypothetical protein ACD_19C00182G0054 [uncultured bacterium]|nr:MAG: hypothetical protein ACD_19C00182G0054 [uncultured bacterium]
MDNEPVSSFVALLENGAMELKKDGVFTTEFSSSDLDKLMRSMLKQSEDEMRKQGVTATINRLSVNINNGKGKVETEINASKKVGFLNPSVNISATFGLENEVNTEGKPTGKLKTAQLEVLPETLFMVVRPMDFLAPYVGGDKINATFKQVMDIEMGKRGAKVNEIKLEFTPENRLKIEAKGSSK